MVTGPFIYRALQNRMRYRARALATTLKAWTPDYYTVYVTNESGCVSDYIFAAVFPLEQWEATLDGVYADANANGIADVGDVINYTISVTNPFNCDFNELGTTLFSNSFGLSGVLFPTVPGNSTATYNFTFLLTQPYINYGSVPGYVYLSGYFPGFYLNEEVQDVVDLDIPDGLLLNAFVDANANGVRDGNEVIFTGGKFNVTINNDGIVHQNGSSGSQYHIYESNPLTTYDLSLSIDGLLCDGAFACNTSYNDLSVPTGSGITTINFPVTPTPCENVGVSIQSGGGVPGGTHWNFITYWNHGTLTDFGGTLTYTMPPMASISSVSDAAAVVTPTGFTLGYSDLQPGEVRTVVVWLNLPPIPGVMLGDMITASVSTTVPTADSFAADNSSSTTYMIVGAYDPNDKTEIHGPEIVFSEFTSDDFLTYTINFENTGNGPATNVEITDMLSAALDASTFRMVDSSHACTYQLAGSDLVFNFNGIGLQPEEHGHVTFQVKPTVGYAIGDTIENTASIYFDFNPAIVTNTVQTTFIPELSITQPGMHSWVIYPNPSNAVLNIHASETIDTIFLRDVLGKTVMVAEPHAQSTIVNVSGLANGVYFATVISGDSQKTIKFIKE
jgi:uncharacterized repeat protein (TIGR01451 family)